jgi:predicted DNA-binding WGR domain protein
MTTVRRFEFHDNRENSHKFWELHQKSGCYHTEYGRLSGFGRAGSRSKSGQKCDSSYRRATANKIRKGYVEVSSSTQSQSPSPMMSQAPASASVQASKQSSRPQESKQKVSSKIGLLNWNNL